MGLGDELQLVVVLTVELEIVDGGGSSPYASSEFPHQLFSGEEGTFVISEHSKVVLHAKPLFFRHLGFEKDQCAAFATQRGNLIVPLIQRLLVVHQFYQNADIDSFQLGGHLFEGLNYTRDPPVFDEVQFRPFVADDVAHDAVERACVERKEVKLPAGVALPDDFFAVAVVQNVYDIFNAVFAPELLLSLPIVLLP